MATVTPAAIRRNLADTIEAATPTRLSEVAFRRYVQSEDLRESADDAPGSHLLRQYQIRRIGGSSVGEVIHSTQILREEVYEIMVAYPCLENIAGAGGLDDLRDMMREDYRVLHDALFSPYNYVSGVQKQGPPVERFDEEGDIWWLVLELPVLFYEALSL